MAERKPPWRRCPGCGKRFRSWRPEGTQGCASCLRALRNPRGFTPEQQVELDAAAGRLGASLPATYAFLAWLKMQPRVDTRPKRTGISYE